MHELALAEGILAVVLDVAEERAVRRVRLRIGDLQSVVPDSLRFSFQLLAEDTPAAAAALEIRPVRARVRCTRCGATSGLAASLFKCRRCGGADTEIVAGDELVVDAVEREDGWRYRPRRTRAKVGRDHLMDHAAQDGGRDGIPRVF